VIENGKLVSVAVAHVDPRKVELAKKFQQRYPPDPNAPMGTANVARTGKAELYSDIPDELLATSARDQEQLRMMRDLGLRSAMVVPLIARGRSLGAFTLVAAESERRFFAAISPWPRNSGVVPGWPSTTRGSTATRRKPFASATTSCRSRDTS
jgi:GAF domain-containing protein